VPKTLKIVGLGGSLAGNSKSRAALRTALDGAASVGAATQLLDTRHLGLRMYNPDDHEATETAATLIESCHAAAGLLWSSPLYQGTISGALKNALDCRLHEPAVDYVVGACDVRRAGRGKQRHERRHLLRRAEACHPQLVSASV
jgi:NAD(P)H-dependent FMN reductase